MFDGLGIVAAHLQGTGAYELTVHGAIGSNYVLEASSNLGEWSPLFSFVCQSTNYPVTTPWDAFNPMIFFHQT